MIVGGKIFGEIPAGDHLEVKGVDVVEVHEVEVEDVAVLALRPLRIDADVDGILGQGALKQAVAAETAGLVWIAYFTVS